MAKKVKARRTVATASQHAEAEPTFSAFMNGKLKRMGAHDGARRFMGDGLLRKRQSKKWYQRFLDDGGRVGDFQSFLTWLIEHADQIIAFISKLIAMFTV